ncbi:MAG: methionine--tRNA ligase [Candidatus Thermoplasmatota archaeon]|nr:methionine--tRNA ligase [Candidatus Thermoplasmatota archaeon]
MPEEKIYIGVAWPYANGAMHMGHVAGCYLPADIFARFQRQRGRKVLMVSGSDEHGTPIMVTAEKEGITPEAVAKRFHKINTASIDGMGISFDLFTETSTDNHKAVTQDIFLRLKENGYIYLKDMTSPYCPSCQRFLPDRYVEGECPHCQTSGARGDQCDACGKTLDPEELVNPLCKLCGAQPELRQTEHFFLRLSAFQDQLLQYVQDKDHWRQNSKRFTENWLRAGLKDRPITRDIKWGIDIPVEGYDDKKIYVWFEAVIGYLSASKEWSQHQGAPNRWEEWWKDPECRHYYFIGKDNIPFHTIIWPSMLMGYRGLNLPYDVVSNEYLHFKGEKLSKSKGNIVSIQDYLEAGLPPDHLRYYLTTNAPENRDSDFTWDDFLTRVNEELVSTLGNYVHRVMTFTEKHFGQIPEMGDLEELDREMLEEMDRKVSQVADCLEACRFKDGLKALMELARSGNVYLDRTAPWKTVKEDKARCATTLHVSLKLVKALAVAGHPFMPHAAEKLWAYLGEEDIGIKWDHSTPLQNVKLSKPEILFKKLEKSDIDRVFEGGKPMEHLDLRVATIKSVEDHPNADKLYVLTIDLGEETRTLVAGLRPYYSREQMEGRQIVVVANLKPAKLRGVESRGMLLAADDGKGTVALITPTDKVESGKSIQGTTKGAPQIEFDRFLENPLTIEEVEGKKMPVFHGEKDVPLLLGGNVFLSPEKDVPPGSRVK